MSTSNEIQKALNDWIVKQSNLKMQEVVDGVKEKTPVKTGRARDGWQVEQDIKQVGDTGRIVNEVPYIGWLNFGTDRMSGHHMVERTLQEVSKK